MLQTLNFLAGGRQINAAATFFRYESGSAGGADESIRVRADGNDLGLYFPGDAIELPVQASTWEIMPVNAATVGVVRLGVGRVQSARLSGTVRVIDAFSDNLQGITYDPGLAVKNYTSLALVTPAQNINGAIVRWVRASSTAGAGGTAMASVTACKSAPTDFGAPVNRYPFATAYSGGQAVAMEIFVNKQVPPGWGIYGSAQILTAAASVCNAQVGIELL